MVSKTYAVRMDIFVTIEDEEDVQAGSGEAVQKVYDLLWGTECGDYDLVSVNHV